ncbi:MAG TPA: stalk domain-containing protein [Fimbriimonadaceae bacterium]|nr:stalk domain-containing protein [Fimbriimonadaceae bacterium]
MNRQTSLGIGASALLFVLAAVASADTVKLQRDDVIPVVMESELSLSHTQAGDVFKADVDDSHMLPWGSRVEGVVRRVVQKHGKTPAFMDIEFTSIILPDGKHVEFHGTPIPLSKNYVTRDRDGRWLAKKGVSRETVVLGATAGGLLLGSMESKPFEGAFLGALLGILASETDKQDIGDGDIVVPKGSRVGARVDEDLTISFAGRWNNHGANDDRYGPYDSDGYNKAGYDRYGYDRDGRYDAGYDSARDGDPGSRQSGAADSGYDQYGFDRNGHYNPKYDTTRDAPPPGQAGPALQVEIGHKAMRYKDGQAAYKDGWVLMVPLKATAEQLGFTVSADQAPDSYRIENDTEVLIVQAGSRDYTWNHNNGSLPTRVSVRDGVAYIPVDAFTRVVKGSVVVNGTKYRSQS